MILAQVGSGIKLLSSESIKFNACLHVESRASLIIVKEEEIGPTSGEGK